ncbi:MAG: hypothetical protein NW226_24265 [Microscillaceae bacterium]|nr:hypothetical protein [Microscillaceae bacterium]
MNIAALYQAILDKKLYHTISTQSKNGKTYLKFKRHLNTFTFICAPSKTEEGEWEYTLLKDQEKARLGTLRAMWADYQESLGKS